MILLVDADSLIFASCYKKREHPEDEKYYTDTKYLTTIVKEL